MEESHQVVELRNLSYNEYMEQIKKVISEHDVLNICLFLTFRPKNEKKQEFGEKSLQEKTYEMINSIKDKKVQTLALQKYQRDFKTTLKNNALTDDLGLFYQRGNYDKVIEKLAPKARLLEERLNALKQNSKPIAPSDLEQYNNANFYIGNCFFRLKNFSKAADYYLKFQGEQPIKQRAQRMNNLGTCYAIKKSYQSALKYYNEACRTYNECPEEDSSSLLNNIALIYLKCEMYKNAEQYFLRSIEERKLKSPNNKAMLFNSYFHLGTCRKLMGKYEESLSNLYVAYNYSELKTNNRVDVLSEICENYELQQKWSEALSYYERLSEEYENIEKPQGPIYERVSKIHLKMGNLVLASKFAKSAYREYRAAGDERKMSQISSSVVVKISGND